MGMKTELFGIIKSWVSTVYVQKLVREHTVKP